MAEATLAFITLITILTINGNPQARISQQQLHKQRYRRPKTRNLKLKALITKSKTSQVFGV